MISASQPCETLNYREPSSLFDSRDTNQKKQANHRVPKEVIAQEEAANPDRLVDIPTKNINDIPSQLQSARFSLDLKASSSNNPAEEAENMSVEDHDLSEDFQKQLSVCLSGDPCIQEDQTVTPPSSYPTLGEPHTNIQETVSRKQPTFY